MPYAIYHPGKSTSSADTLCEPLGIPRDPQRTHRWIVAGVAPCIIPRLAELVTTDVGVICHLAGISRSTLIRKLRSDTPLSIEQGTRVYGVVQVLSAVLSLHERDTVGALLWLNRPAKGLNGMAPAELLVTPMGVQAVVDLVGQIEHGVCP